MASPGAWVCCRGSQVQDIFKRPHLKSENSYLGQFSKMLVVSSWWAFSAGAEKEQGFLEGVWWLGLWWGMSICSRGCVLTSRVWFRDSDMEGLGEYWVQDLRSPGTVLQGTFIPQTEFWGKHSWCAGHCWRLLQQCARLRSSWPPKSASWGRGWALPGLQAASASGSCLLCGTRP